jgi:hypothetical protein
MTLYRTAFARAAAVGRASHALGPGLAGGSFVGRAQAAERANMANMSSASWAAATMVKAGTATGGAAAAAGSNNAPALVPSAPLSSFASAPSISAAHHPASSFFSLFSSQPSRQFSTTTTNKGFSRPSCPLFSSAYTFPPASPKSPAAMANRTQCYFDVEWTGPKVQVDDSGTVTSKGSVAERRSSPIAQTDSNISIQ